MAAPGWAAAGSAVLAPGSEAVKAVVWAAARVVEASASASTVGSVAAMAEATRICRWL